MVEIVDPLSTSKIVDPACGTGGFLIEAYNYIIGKYKAFHGTIQGIEKDSFLANTAKSICEIYSSGQYKIINQNSLDLKYLKNNEPQLFHADIVLTNPPFGSKIGINDKSILKQFELGFSWVFNQTKQSWEISKNLRATQDPQILFLELCINLLRDKGVLGIVLPEGIFGNKGNGYIWDFVRKNGSILAMIDCPRTTFQPSTDIKTNILFFKKNLKTIKISQEKFKVAIAINCGHDRRGRKTNENGNPLPDDFKVISREFKLDQSTFWITAIIKDKYYLVPRYCQDLNPSNLPLNGSIDDFSGIYSFPDLRKNKFILVKKGNEVGSEAYGTGDVPFVRTSDLANFEITNDPTKAISEEYFIKYNKLQGIKVNDILLVSDGRYRIGKTAIILEGQSKCVVQSHIKIIRVLPKAPFTPFELLYILNQQYTLRQIRNLVFIQSTLGSIGNRIDELLIPIPKRSKHWERKIADFEETLMNRNLLLKKLKTFQTEYSL
jgi:type I restriction enzyme M protein